MTTRILESAAGPTEVAIAQSTLDKVAACRAFALERIASGAQVYGATTGFGPLVGFSGRLDSADQCDNAIAHLLAGQGRDLPVRVVRAAVLARLWSLSQARSGVSVATLSALARMLGTRFAPAVPEFGSVGASGDLIPLAYVAQALRGHGHAYLGEARMPAADALARAGLEPLHLDGRDGLALVNGTSLTAAAAGLASASLRRSHSVALMLTALLTDILGSTTAFVHPELLEAYGHPDAAATASDLRRLLAGCEAGGGRPLQEPYSIRCTPQLLGAVRTAIGFAAGVIDKDLNGVSDNPIFVPEHAAVLHGGNFFGQPVSFAADSLSSTAVQMGNLAERQLDLLVDSNRNGGLPPMLAVRPGEQHGVQGVQLAATATVAAMRRAATPASIQSLPTNGHNQDVVPFGTQAALNTLELAEKLRWLHGSLAVALCQAVHVGRRRPTARRCARILDRLLDIVAPIEPDRPLDTDVRAAAALLDWIATEEDAQEGAPC
ncbi:aromatic amino acid ammonia-lyase [Nocardia goodfellowii]|uniref:Histidine ammonia-lyase/tyrosine ammonia-lyase n=1 Tax=Nocardia goodfellowii TaxID=882446 RepID=A0ABS4QN40_9NOCA|nr:aromatic amino acid ammonia-lyase [Nocardia goodfellowii]MBP2193124.1 histidine ammonia-lyase/tyrosine ammonia-lyase [Nocardia goodfellowii]